MEFGLEKVPRDSLQSGQVHRKQNIGNTMENVIKELELMKACIWVQKRAIIQNIKMENKSRTRSMYED
jgi:Tfp pilus assembly PilM family ATPase